jgi:hypothetical protein
MSRRVKPLPDWNSREPEPMLEWLRAMLDKEMKSLSPRLRMNPSTRANSRKSGKRNSSKGQTWRSWISGHSIRPSTATLNRCVVIIRTWLTSCTCPSENGAIGFIENLCSILCKLLPMLSLTFMRYGQSITKRKSGSVGKRQLRNLLPYWDVDVNDVRNVRKQRRR